MIDFHKYFSTIKIFILLKYEYNILSVVSLFQPFNIRVLHLMTVGCILVVFCILIPASIFAAIEPEWDFLDSLYYCFISLTTVGLGDYIPGDFPNQPYRPFYKIITTGEFSLILYLYYIILIFIQL